MEEHSGILMIKINGEIVHVDIEQISSLLSNNNLKQEEQAV